MNTVINAYAKLNLSLDIVSKMDNGYHALKTVMQTVSLCDQVSITCEPGSGIVAASNFKYIPNDNRNIAVKAVQAFFELHDINGYQASVKIKKRIPVCAGLGGGSTDAAAVLRALDKLFKTDMTKEQLEDLGAKLGSDVPFCIAGGTVLAEGRGEIMTPLPPIPECHVVICKPKLSISTPELFSKIDCGKIKRRPDTQGIITALEQGSLPEVARRMYNVFESFLPPKSGVIADIKAKLFEADALGAVMTGTGSAVFGLFDDRNCAQTAYNSLKYSHRDTFLCKTKPSDEIIV